MRPNSKDDKKDPKTIDLRPHEWKSDNKLKNAVAERNFSNFIGALVVGAGILIYKIFIE